MTNTDEKAPAYDLHDRWAGEVRHLRAVRENLTKHYGPAAGEPLWVASHALLEAIARTRAKTPVGAIEQIRLAIECEEEGSCLGELEMAALKNALATLETMEGGQA